MKLLQNGTDFDLMSMDDLHLLHFIAFDSFIGV
jgi:hypothetical protein